MLSFRRRWVGGGRTKQGRRLVSIGTRGLKQMVWNSRNIRGLGSGKRDEYANGSIDKSLDTLESHICLTSLPFISGLSTSHSSLRTANSESERMTDSPKLQTRVIA